MPICCSYLLHNDNFAQNGHARLNFIIKHLIILFICCTPCNLVICLRQASRRTSCRGTIDLYIGKICEKTAISVLNKYLQPIITYNRQQICVIID